MTSKAKKDKKVKAKVKTKTKSLTKLPPPKKTTTKGRKRKTENKMAFMNERRPRTPWTAEEVALLQKLVPEYQESKDRWIAVFEAGKG